MTSRVNRAEILLKGQCVFELFKQCSTAKLNGAYQTLHLLKHNWRQKDINCWTLHHWPERGEVRKKGEERIIEGRVGRETDGAGQAGLYKGRSRCLLQGPGQRLCLLPFGDPPWLPKLELALPSSPKGIQTQTWGIWVLNLYHLPVRKKAAEDVVREDTGLFFTFPEGIAGIGCFHVVIGCGLLSLWAAWGVHFAQKRLSHGAVCGARWKKGTGS